MEIVSLAVAALTLLIWWLKRSAAKKDDPREQNRIRYEKIDQAIDTRDSAAASADLNADLNVIDRLQNQGGGNPLGTDHNGGAQG